MVQTALRLMAAWLDGTAAARLVQEVSWIIPAVQSAHILAIAALFAPAALLSVRTLGLAFGPVVDHEAERQFAPWVWWALGTLAATGAVMVVGEPGRALMNTLFQVKIGLVLAASATTLLLIRRLRRGDRDAGSKAIAALTLALWVLIIIAGRWIGYTESGDL